MLGYSECLDNYDGVILNAVQLFDSQIQQVLVNDSELLALIPFHNTKGGKTMISSKVKVGAL